MSEGDRVQHLRHQAMWLQGMSAYSRSRGMVVRSWLYSLAARMYKRRLHRMTGSRP